MPQHWKKHSYPSLKPLASYISDFIRRMQYFHEWIDHATPRVHWISGFYFTQTFLTATLQNFARKYQIPIDTITFQYQFYGEPSSNPERQADLVQYSEGSLIYGLFLEGAQWSYKDQMLAESEPKILYTKAPIILLQPTEQAKCAETKAYPCPVYKTLERRGVLSTTGHSTNYIMSINLNTNLSEWHWVKRGVAMFCQLSD